MKITAEQQHLIDLIKTQEPKNIRLALELDIVQDLGVGAIYHDIYLNWEFLKQDEWREYYLLFPIVSLIPIYKTFSLRHFYLVNDFDNDLDLFYDFLKCLKKFIFNDFDTITLHFQKEREEMGDKLYLMLNDVEDEIHKITGIEKQKIQFDFFL